MMSDKNNEEKLRILRERLNQIQEKKGTEKKSPVDNEKTRTYKVEESLNEESPAKPVKPSKNTNAIKYFILLFGIILLAYLGYEYVDIDSLSKKNEIINEIDNNIKSDVNEEITDDENLVYYKSDFNGNYIIIISSFIDLDSAKNELNKLKNLHYNCDILQLSGVSNSNKDLFQTYIEGPSDYSFVEDEGKSEANQWITRLKQQGFNPKIISLQ